MRTTGACRLWLTERPGMSKGSESCATCVHGHDLSIDQGAAVICAPQRTFHPADYCCSAFRRITQAEIDERTLARFGTPVLCGKGEFPKPGG